MPSDGGGQKHKEEVFFSSKADISMKLHFYGADRCVTGSCHCLEINGKKILVDCGLQQGRDELDNRYLAFAPGNIDILLVTHAHIDHTGRIPLLVKNGFQFTESDRAKPHPDDTPDSRFDEDHVARLRSHSGERR